MNKFETLYEKTMANLKVISSDSLDEKIKQIADASTFKLRNCFIKII